MYAAIDLLMDKLDRQVLKHKDKIQDHQHDGIKRHTGPDAEAA
jgi:putative sigma-54 modulation protein